MLVQNDIFLNPSPSNITLFSRTPSSFLIHWNTKKNDKYWYESDTYIKRSICRQQLFLSFRAHQRSWDQIKILKDQSAHTTTRAVGIAIYTYINFKAINNVLDAKIVLKTHFFIKIFRLLCIHLYISLLKYKRSKIRVFSYFRIHFYTKIHRH